jgi:hypothetical protein
MNNPAIECRSRPRLRRSRARLVVATLFKGSTPAARDAAAARWQADRRWQRLSAVIRTHQLERPAIVAIKMTHTAIFALLMSCVVFSGLAGVRNRMTRRSALALVAILGEGLVISRNQGRCPLTDIVEELGSEHGWVSEIFLPGPVARHIPHISCAVLGQILRLAPCRDRQRSDDRERISA